MKFGSSSNLFLGEILGPVNMNIHLRHEEEEGRILQFNHVVRQENVAQFKYSGN
jgi:hypothetical protein